MQDLSTYSRFVQRLRRRYADELHRLPAGAPVLATMQACFDTLRQTHSCGDSLRMLRQLVMERLVVLDCEQRAELQVITRAVTELGEFTSMRLSKKRKPSSTPAMAHPPPPTASAPPCGSSAWANLVPVNSMCPATST